MLKHNFLHKVLQISSDSASAVALANLMDYCCHWARVFLLPHRAISALSAHGEQWAMGIFRECSQVPGACILASPSRGWTQGPGCPPVPSTTLTPAMDTHLGRWGPERHCYFTQCWNLWKKMMSHSILDTFKTSFPIHHCLSYPFILNVILHLWLYYWFLWFMGWDIGKTKILSRISHTFFLQIIY